MIIFVKNQKNICAKDLIELEGIKSLQIIKNKKNKKISLKSKFNQ